jgi:hypothetical protein
VRLVQQGRFLIGRFLVDIHLIKFNIEIRDMLSVFFTIIRIIFLSISFVSPYHQYQYIDRHAAGRKYQIQVQYSRYAQVLLLLSISGVGIAALRRSCFSSVESVLCIRRGLAAASLRCYRRAVANLRIT